MSTYEAQEMLRSIVDDVLMPAADVDEPDGVRHEVWATMCDLGWPAVGMPEDDGGAGGTLEDLVTILRGVGRHAVPVPLAEQALGLWVAEEFGAELLHPEGLAVVLTPRAAGSLVSDGTDDQDVRVSGELAAIPWASHARWFVVPAVEATGRSASWMLIDATDDRVARIGSTSLAGEPRARVTLRDTPGWHLSSRASHQEAELRQLLYATALLVGAMEGAHALTRAYVAERRQFDRPLAKLPTVRSELGRSVAQVDLALGALQAATRAVADKSPFAETAVVAARLTSVETAGEVARICHDLHGAMGVTREYPLHRYTRRIWSWRDEPGAERHWRRTMAHLVLERGSAGFWDDVSSLSEAAAGHGTTQT